MSSKQPPLEQVDPDAYQFYRKILVVMRDSGIPFLVGGAYASAYYTGIVRHTKDLDLFVRPDHAHPTLAALGAAGYRTELTFPHWLGKAFQGDGFVDVIFSSGNGACAVDDGWFAHAVEGQVLGTPERLIPVEEMIWQKAYIMERERFDGADVQHLLRARGPHLDWDRLLARFGPHWRVLLSHLVLFGFVYPAEPDRVPAAVLRTLTERLLAGGTGAGPAVCQGPLLSRIQYLADTEQWGYEDPRLPPEGKMTADQVLHWTAAAFEW